MLTPTVVSLRLFQMTNWTTFRACTLLCCLFSLLCYFTALTRQFLNAR